MMALVGAGTSLSSSTVAINELTTAAAGTVLMNFGLLTSTGTVNGIANNAGAINAIARYNSLVTAQGALNSA
ncbi:MAG: hypothetical protein ACHQ2F_06735, partial [Desulfobaccales bacterium]